MIKRNYLIVISFRSLWLRFEISVRIPSMAIIESFNPYLPTPPLGQDMTQGQFLSSDEQVWIQRFPSPRLVASPGLKNLVFSLSWRENNWIHSFSMGY